MGRKKPFPAFSLRRSNLCVAASGSHWSLIGPPLIASVRETETKPRQKIAPCSLALRGKRGRSIDSPPGGRRRSARRSTVPQKRLVAARPWARYCIKPWRTTIVSQTGSYVADPCYRSSYAAPKLLTARCGFGRKVQQSGIGIQQNCPGGIQWLVDKLSRGPADGLDFRHAGSALLARCRWRGKASSVRGKNCRPASAENKNQSLPEQEGAAALRFEQPLRLRSTPDNWSLGTRTGRT